MDRHIPVLVHHACTQLSVQEGDVIVDATVGTGGHAVHLLRDLSSGTYVGIDADDDALTVAKERLTPIAPGVSKQFFTRNFRDLVAIVREANVAPINAIIADLGWGTHQLSSGRGFSFTTNEVLNMCYGTAEQACSCTALDIVNSWHEQDIADIIRTYGEDRWARMIARRIVQVRREKPIVMTHDLAQLVSDTIPRRHHLRGLHPATKTFQALRVAVNDELQTLQQFLDAVPSIVASGARLCIISFHSVEDRVVKRCFVGWEERGLGTRTKRALRPSEQECTENRRSRSAKLRTFTFS